MPYTIQTKDGITINNIPDDIAKDDPSLKQRVADIRAQRASGNMPAQSKPVIEQVTQQIAPENPVVLNIPRQGAAPTQGNQETFIDRLNRELQNIPRQVGLAARYLVEGPTEIAGTFIDPLTDAYNRKFGTNVPTTGQVSEQITSPLPKPETGTEKIVGQASKMITSVAPVIRGAQVAAKAGSVGGKILAELPGSQLAGAAAGGAAGEYAAQKGGNDLTQAGAAMAGAIGGATTVSALGKVINSAMRAVKGVGSRTAEAILSDAVKKTGFKMAEIPQEIRQSIIKDINKGIKSGKKELDPQALQRLADYRSLGAKPTKGKITLDPATITREENLRKAAAQIDDPRMSEYARVPRQNELVIMSKLDDMGAGTAVRPIESAEIQQEALRRLDKPVKKAVDTAYESVRGAEGRYANLNTKAFSEAANTALDEGQLGRLLPAEARSILNDISDGTIPFNVNTAQQYDRTLSMMQRSSKPDAAYAIGKVRDALKKTPIESMEGEQAMQMHRAATGMARKRFQKIESTPALKAALDEEAPDAFMQTYILGSGKKATVKAVDNLAKELKKDPEAYGSARDQIVSFLKKSAVGSKENEVASFSADGYLKALDKLIDKMPSFFSKEEIAQLKTIGRVAKYESYQPKGSAINNSNTASALYAMLDRVASSNIVGSIPGGDILLKNPARNILNAYNLRSAGNVNVLKNIEKQRLLQPTLAIPAIAEIQQ